MTSPPEVDKDALLVRAALDIMTFQSRTARLELELEEAYRRAAKMVRAVRGGSKPDDFLSLEKAVSLYISSTYYACDRDVAKAAKILGISRPTLYKYLPIRVARQRKEMARHREVVRHEPSSTDR